MCVLFGPFPTFLRPYLVCILGSLLPSGNTASAFSGYVAAIIAMTLQDGSCTILQSIQTLHYALFSIYFL